ncbi:MAG: MCE family protein [Streptosporangiales bacterium]|nr:MCE family protein [Streptosporangiales bacterium]
MNARARLAAVLSRAGGGPLRLGACAVAASLLVSGCGFTGMRSVTLPGGPDVGDEPYAVRVEFSNVLDLVPQSLVKVNDVTVGRVEKVELAGADKWYASVTLRLRKDVRLPDNSTARIQQTSLLGEKYVALAAPTAEPRTGALSEGDLIPLRRTGASAEIEEVLSAASLVLTGGGVEQIATINRELNAVMEGRTHKIKDVLRQVDHLVKQVDRQKASIVRTIDSVDRLTATLAKNRKVLADTLDETPAALKVLKEQRKDLTKLLVSVDSLGEAATRVIRRSKDDTLANLRSLRPLLTEIGKSAEALPEALPTALTFPFPDSIVNTLRGDYANTWFTLELGAKDVLNNLLTGTPLQSLIATGGKGPLLGDSGRTPSRKGPLGLLPEYGGDGGLLGGGSGGSGAPGSPGTGSPGQSPDGGSGSGLGDLLLGGS